MKETIISIRYVSLMVTTKPKATLMQKDKEKRIKHTTMENNQFTKEDTKKGRKEQGNYKTARK